MSTEKVLQRNIVKAVKARYPDAWSLVVHGNGYQRVGVPDILISLHGQLLAFEVKLQRPGESIDHLHTRVSPTQRAEIAALRRSGAHASVVWTVEQVIRVLEEIDGERGPLNHV